MRIILLLLKVFWKKAIYKIIQSDEFLATLLGVPDDLSRKTPAINTFGRDLQKSTKKAKKILWIKDKINHKKKYISCGSRDNFNKKWDRRFYESNYVSWK